MIPKGNRQDIVNATINSSYLWDSCKLLALTKNMRLRAKVNDDSNNDLRLLAEWILAIGDGKCKTSIEGIDNIQIFDDNLIEK